MAVVERKTSSPTIGLIFAAVLCLLLSVYVGAYWWRLPASIPYGFPTAFEERIFKPAVLIHLLLHPASYRERVSGNGIEVHDTYIHVSP